MLNWKEFLASPEACIACLVLIFIAIRLFATGPFYLVAVDEARYLELADNFPHHTMHAGTLFLQHMPAYPYLVALSDFVLNNDLASGLLVSFVMAALTLVVLLVLFRTLGRPGTWQFIFALLFSLSWPLAELSRLVFKETTYVFFWWAAVVFFWLGLKKSGKWLWASAAAAFLAGFSSDQVIFLFPVLVILWFLVPAKRPWLLKALPIALGGIAYGIWLLIRIQFYLSHAVAPVGIDGIIEDVSHFGPGQVLNPFSFPESGRLSLSSRLNNPVQIISNLGYLIDSYPFLITPNLSRQSLHEHLSVHNIAFLVLIYLPAAIWTFVWLLRTAKKTFKAGKFRNNPDVFFAAAFLILVIPIFTGVGNWRHIILSAIPVLYFVTNALFAVFRKFVEKDVVRQAFVILAALFVIAWIIAHPHFSLGAIKIVQGSAVAKEVQKLPGSGIFVQTGYSMELDYLLEGKRVYGLVSDISNMERYLGMFNITYVVLGSKAWAPVPEYSPDFISSRPDYFIPIKTVTEAYPVRNFAPDTFTVYAVNQSLQLHQQVQDQPTAVGAALVPGDGL